MTPINIAIDGYSSCGKSTLAKQLASHLGFIYIDSGAMYRAITLFALNSGLYEREKLNREKLLDALDDVRVEFKRNGSGTAPVLLNGKEVEDEIRQMRVSEKVSEIAAIPEVRQKLVRMQQEMAAKKGVVMDGRDIGTHVIPDAEVKLFMTAKPEVRAQRRFDELKGKGLDVTFEEVLENLRSRDEQDTTRETNPLRKADDAIEFDNSEIGLDAQFDYALEIVKKAIPQP